ncbi:MAG: alpha-L-fucosidase [Planctomycetota bacterium]|nr:alpha-L-fucosidase [Planctomycetota bacterium]
MRPHARRRLLLFTIIAALLLTFRVWPLEAQVVNFNEQRVAGNKPERVEWFKNLGFGIFIHFSVDAQLGCVISHSLVGADEDYCRRFFEELPKTFNPKQFNADDWADLAKISGCKYVVVNTKHHSGFCMYNTATTPFCITNTPFKRDITAELFEALRKRGIAVGVYFSPDDFWFLRKQGTPITRKGKGASPLDNPQLMKHNLAQTRELFTNYGPIDIFFIDGVADGVRDLAWELQPNVLITRGAMSTPEQHVPGKANAAPWESCMTMGTQWQYKPTNEHYKSGGQLIRLLVETRAKGGNFLLNVGPRPNGLIPREQNDLLRELGLWIFINHDAVFAVEPWITTREDNIWFTKKRGENTVYAIVTHPKWKNGTRRTFNIRSVKASPKTTVRVLGHNNRTLEYSPKTDASTKWKQTDTGLEIDAMRAQRIYNDRGWPNAVVLKITDARSLEITNTKKSTAKAKK